MKSLVCIAPGHLAYEQHEMPPENNNDAIIRIKRIGICGTDLHAFEGTQPYFTYPRILGHELSGEIVYIGNTGTGFSTGDTVTIIPYLHCGFCFACRSGKTNCCENLNVAGVHIDGGFSEYFSVPVSYLVKGNGLNEDQLALIEPLSIGAHGIRRARIMKDDVVLVTGAGPIGLGLMEFAGLEGAHVIAMDVDDSRLDFCRNHMRVINVINPMKENALEKLKEITNGDLVPIVIDATGNLSAINSNFRYMAHGGKYVLVGLQKGEIVFSHPDFHKKEGTLMSSRNATKEDFSYVIKSVSSGVVDPLKYITHRVTFAETRELFPSFLKRDSGIIKAVVSLD